MSRARRNGRPHWTEAEVTTLRREWGEISGRSWRKHLPRRSWLAIRTKAKALGLPFYAPQGWCSITEAAKRAGYSVHGLWPVLRWADVLVKRHPFAAPSRSTSATWLIVEWDAVREAVERRAGFESVGEAARRHGLETGCLYPWLRAAGVVVPRRRGVPHLIPSEVIDRVVAERRPPESYRSVREAAKAEGVVADGLLRGLKRAGWQSGGAKGACRPVPKALVRQVLEARRAA